MIPQEVLNKITEYINHIFNKRQANNTQNAPKDNSLYLSLAKDKEEQEDIEELCEEIDFYYEERAKLKASKMKAYRFLEQRAIEMYKEYNPEATDEECETFLSDVRDTLDNVLTNNANVFARETDEIEVDDYDQSELFLSMVENKLISNEAIVLPIKNSIEGKEMKE